MTRYLAKGCTRNDTCKGHDRFHSLDKNDADEYDPRHSVDGVHLVDVLRLSRNIARRG